MAFFEAIGNFILWIISIGFVLLGLIGFIGNAFISGIIFIVTALIVNPKVRFEIEIRWFEIPIGISILAIFVGLFSGTMLLPTSDTVSNNKETVSTSNNVNPIAEAKAKEGREKKAKNEENISTTIQSEKIEESTEWWSNLEEPALKDDIINAFKEIGEKPEYIISIEHVKDIETDLFVRRHYKLCFDKGNILDLFDDDDKHFINAVEWRIITIEWYEGEPEREQYPREYLSAIKFWKDDDSTMVLQWSQLGDGVLQEIN